MLTLIEAHPNIDAMVFYAIASAILAATLYYYNRVPDRGRRAR